MGLSGLTVYVEDKRDISQPHRMALAEVIIICMCSVPIFKFSELHSNVLITRNNITRCCLST